MRDTKTLVTLVKAGISIGVACVILFAISSIQQIVRGQGQHMKTIIVPGEGEAIALLREFDRKRDKERLNLVLKHLNHKSERVRAFAALVVGRLGIKELEEKLQQMLVKGQEHERDAAKVALARLKAEVSTTNPSEQISIFFRELGLRPTHLKRAGWERKAHDLPTSFETMALRELADIVAKANQKGIDMSSWEKKIPFEVDYPSALKVKLSKMGQRERIAFLILNILTLRPTWERECDAQALADEGNIAVPAIISALQKIHDEIKRNGFTKSSGAVEILIDTLGYIGDKRALPILQAFVDQPGILWYHPQKPIDHFTRERARVAIQSIKSRKKSVIISDYW